MMYRNYFSSGGFGYPFFAESFIGLFLIPFVVWSIAWKGWALWKAAKNDSLPWFIALLLLNTAGILDILYIFVFGKEKGVKSSKKK